MILKIFVGFHYLSAGTWVSNHGPVNMDNGLIAGGSSSSTNCGIALSMRALNPLLYLIVDNFLAQTMCRLFMCMHVY